MKDDMVGAYSSSEGDEKYIQIFN